ncbi:MAG: potassium transporter [Desulfococcaceae bacterium]
MEKIWIIGAGRFGLLSLDHLAESHEDARFVLVDSDIKGIELFDCSSCSVEESDGVEFLQKHLYQENAPDWIIPALPVHLAAEWCLRRLGPDLVKRTVLPAETDPQIPHPIRGENGDIYVTHATFLCPDRCSEPGTVCTVTGKPRPKNMFEVLADIQVPGFRPLVIRSHQLAPGVGGYRPKSLFELLESVKNADTSLIVSTACRCHGVLTGICPAKKGQLTDP